SRPISCIPNAGLPLNTGTGDAGYPLEPAPMAEMLGEFVEKFGVRIVGGCCGTRPEQLRAIVDRIQHVILRSAAPALSSASDEGDSGAHVLDVCVALTERADEAEQMAKVVKLLSMSVETPIMVDSTEANVIEAALEHIPGRAIINSINMENGRKRIDSVVPL